MPFFQLAVNIVKAWSHGKKGILIFENASKMSAFEEGSIQIPLIQPSKSVVVEVATYLKNHLSADQRLIEAHPDSINRIWEKICQDCDFNIYRRFNGDIKMTEKYINQKATQLQKTFE